MLWSLSFVPQCNSQYVSRVLLPEVYITYKQAQIGHVWLHMRTIDILMYVVMNLTSYSLIGGGLNDYIAIAIQFTVSENLRRAINQNIITQLLNGLQQLTYADKCHNDIKPDNVLYQKTNNAYSIKIADFGRCGGSGGTPGWTAPVFHRKRQPGKEDMFSVGWLCLHLLCESKDLFLSLRDNYVEDVDAEWMTGFRSMTEINFVHKLVDLESQPSVEQVKDHWNRIKPSVKMIDIPRLEEIGVPRSSLPLQIERPK